MGKRMFARLGVAAAAGGLALASAGPALAHEMPAPGFNAVLHAGHHDKLATDESAFPQLCGTVREDLGDAADELIKDGFDVWVFNANPSFFDKDADPIAQLEFKDLADDAVVVTIPSDAFAWWVRPVDEPHLIAVSVPAGWTLSDGDFLLGEEDGPAVRVTHTCPDGEPGNGNGNGTPTPTTTPTTTTTPGDGNGGGGDEEPKLPVTGMQVGGLALLGAGLLAGGIAMMAVRRRRSLASLLDES